MHSFAPLQSQQFRKCSSKRWFVKTFMLQNAYLRAKIGADTAENERKFAEIFSKICNYPRSTPGMPPLMPLRSGSTELRKNRPRWLQRVRLSKIDRIQLRIGKFCKSLSGSFSAVSKRNFARKYAFDSVFQALQDLHLFAPLQS